MVSIIESETPDSHTMSEIMSKSGQMKFVRFDKKVGIAPVTIEHRKIAEVMGCPEYNFMNQDYFATGDAGFLRLEKSRQNITVILSGTTIAVLHKTRDGSVMVSPYAYEIDDEERQTKLQEYQDEMEAARQVTALLFLGMLHSLAQSDNYFADAEVWQTASYSEGDAQLLDT